MKLFWFCTLVAVLGPVRGFDVECEYDDDVFTTCTITAPATLKMGEKMNIVSAYTLNFIDEFKFYAKKENRSQISSVPSEIFEQLHNLTICELYANIEVLNKGDFENTGKLRSLVIESQLKIIPAGVLGSAKNLLRLTLSGNHIAEIEVNAFSGLNELFSLDLERNKLTTIKENTFNGLENLIFLYLQSNQIESIEENALNLPNLKELNVRDNKLTSLPDNLFSATPFLETVHANRNQINHIGKSLYGLGNLKFLFLSENKLIDVDLVAFSQIPKLVKLYLGENGLTSESISKIEIKEPSISVLSILSLAGNELTNNEDWAKFAIFPQLETIEAENNNYSKIDLGDKTLRQQFSKLWRVFVSSGEWNCDWLRNFTTSSKKDRIDVVTRRPSSASDKNVNRIGCV